MIAKKKKSKPRYGFVYIAGLGKFKRVEKSRLHIILSVGTTAEEIVYLKPVK